MTLRIETYSNRHGGNCFFKAIGHPIAHDRWPALRDRLAACRSIALYDIDGFAEGFAEIHNIADLPIGGVYVQDIARIGTRVLGHKAQPVTDLASSDADIVLVATFDSDRAASHIAHLLPEGAEMANLDEIRLPDEMLTNRRRYLDPINFATNFAFFRDADGHHTRLVTANYWAGYGAEGVALWCRLFGSDGAAVAEWRETLPDSVGGVTIDSKAIRSRFGLGSFTGQLFLHVVGARGHDVVKYALDTYGDDSGILSCTHDANAWPADFYAGLPAPDEGERVVLWIQNSHPRPIPPRAIGLGRMGGEEIVRLESEIGPFATYALDVAKLLPDLAWPDQIEVDAGRHFVRPRYEVEGSGGQRRIAHVNVERTDLAPDPRIPELGNLMGKGYILPAPVLPTDRFDSILLPTPMARTQIDLPVSVLVYDADGGEVARRSLGRLPRGEIGSLDIATLLDGKALPSGYGHLELVYDFAEGGGADGWLHGLFRYRDRHGGHAAETSFGAHIFNTVLTYRGEPQSYSGPAPGLSTRLFLRLGPAPLDTMCHLIYPASTPWHQASQTSLSLHDGDGREIATREMTIPCGGSRLWRYSETFDEAQRQTAGEDAYIIVRDTSCRLFGYHGLLSESGAFSFDHMFGF
ncbi:MAG: hypothetical protein HOH66_05930 [Rhodospirillaceae bacterium]|jgi:hypothetical protein|nr:hypothetical protein [Rhodospirillaceae bacterium]MBT6117388.1 hypothetical protein [Rhodospirillaceae bacterium]